MAKLQKPLRCGTAETKNLAVVWRRKVVDRTVATKDTAQRTWEPAETRHRERATEIPRNASRVTTAEAATAGETAASETSIRYQFH